MKKFCLRYITLIILFLVTIPLLSQNVKEFRILYWNDFHSANIPFKANKKEIKELEDSVSIIGGSAYLKSYIEKYKDEKTLLLNAGDDFQGSPASTVTKGKSQIELMNLMMPDAMTLGNHEFDYSFTTLREHLKEAKFKIVNSNLVNRETKENYFDPYLIFERNGIKIAVIGIITSDLVSLTLKDNLKDIIILKEIPTIRKYIKELSETEKPDVYVLLSHCGIDDDITIADSIPDIDIIIGGHSHTRLKTPKKQNKTIICQAGEKGKYLGLLDLKVDIEGDSIVSYKGELIPTVNAKVEPNKEVSAKVEEIESRSLAGLGEVIGTLKSDWVRTYNEESNIGNWMADVIKDFSKADIAFQNSGGIRKNLSAGNITIRDVWEIAPFDNTIVYFSLRGDSILMLFEHQVNGYAEKLQVSGVEYKYDENKPIGKRIVSIKIDGKKVNQKKYYRIGTNNYVAAQGKKYFGFNIEPGMIKNLEKEGKDLFIEYIKKQNVIDSKLEKRMQKVNK